MVSFCHILYCPKPLNGLAKTMRDIQALKHYNVVAKPVGCFFFFFLTYHEIVVVNNRLVTDFQHKMFFYQEICCTFSTHMDDTSATHFVKMLKVNIFDTGG